MTRAAGLPKRRPMKSGIVSEPSASVKVRSRGATATQASSDIPITNGISRNQVTPQS